MIELGSAARTLIASAAAANAAQDAEEAAVFIKHVALGGSLADLAPPPHKESADAVVASVGRAAMEKFNDWLDKHDVPQEERKIAMGALESCGAREIPHVVKALTPARTGQDTVRAVFLDIASRDPIFTEDLVVRDIGWAFARAVFAAAEEQRDKLLNLEVRLAR